MTSSGFLSKPVMDGAQNRRAAVLGLLYAVIVAVSFFLAFEIRFDFIVPPEFQEIRLRMLWIAIGVKLVALISARQLGSLMTYFSVPDFVRLMGALIAASAALFTSRFFSAFDLGVPRGVLLIDFMLCSGLLSIGRLSTRVYRERLAGHRRGQRRQQRIAIIGAGDAGAALAREFINNPSNGFRPVMFFDDDAEKHGKRIHGLLVVGRPELVDEKRLVDSFSKAVIAMPSASPKRIKEVVLLFTRHGLPVETLPSMEQLASGRVQASRIRPVEVEDLLGREPIDLDSDGIRRSIQDRVVLVTGAGGSIGSELCRQIAALAPQRLLMVEQAEGSLFNIEQELGEMGLGTHAVALVGDILDEERMRYIFSHYRPEIVFHAAAHKHVSMMERQPAEAVRNNVLGTRQLARIAVETQVGAFVLISTDKAINPTSVMGATKRLAELQMMAIAATQEETRKSGKTEKLKSEAAVAETRRAAELLLRTVAGEAPGVGLPSPTVAVQTGSPTAPTRTTHPFGSHFSVSASQHFSVSSRGAAVPPRPFRPTKFMAVRFGNVLGSSGSVIPIFKRQIANGGPVTVTHPEVTRYFMTIPEAVGLVLQASILGKGGEIFVLDMGRPVKIQDLARQMIELSGFKVGEDIQIRFTGLKPGEKLYEELQHKTEHYTSTEHPRIMRFTSTAMFSESGVQELQQSLYAMEPNAMKLVLQRLVPEYTPYLD